jgi:hypothetical protein
MTGRADELDSSFVGAGYGLEPMIGTPLTDGVRT